MGWFARLFGAAPAARPAREAPASELASMMPEAAAVAKRQPLASWLLGAEVAPERPLSAEEKAAVAEADDVLARPVLGSELLPRAASVVPQLMAMLRQSDQPVAVIAEQITKDPAMAAEVLRMASSAHYRRGQEVTDLRRAVAVLGADGLRIAITRVLMRPLYQVNAGTMTARTAPRLWQHAEVLSRHASQGARAAGLAVFDGYLAGLLHGTGWTVLFRALDVAGLALAEAPGSEAAAAFEARAHRLFGLAAKAWDITPAFGKLAADARQQPLVESTQPLALVLWSAHAAALAELAAADGSGA